MRTACSVAGPVCVGRSEQSRCHGTSPVSKNTVSPSRSAIASMTTTAAFAPEAHAHCRRVRADDLLERIQREMRRRSRVVGAFPDGQSPLNLAATRLRYIAGRELSTELLDMDPAEGPADKRNRCQSPVRSRRSARIKSAKGSGHMQEGTTSPQCAKPH
jgi:hypothetical protein